MSLKMREMQVKQLLSGALIREGAGVKLHRYLGFEKNNEFDPFLLFDYFDSQEPLEYMAGFPPHPHRGFETITYLWAGQIHHADNQGHEGTIGPGDVQWMTAGKGIMHSEMPDAEKPLHGLQLWLNLPARDKMKAPRYQEMKSEQFPIEKTADFDVKVIAGQTPSGILAPITGIATKPLFFDIHLYKNKSYQQKLPSHYQTILFVVSGLLRIGEEKIPAKYLASISAGELLSLQAEEDSHFLLISAEKLEEPIARHGPFVMNTKEEIMQAIEDFRNGRF